MRKICRYIMFLLLFLIFTGSSYSREILDKVIISVGGNKEYITLLEFEKRKNFTLKNLKNIQTSQKSEIDDKEIIKKLIFEKLILILSKDNNIYVPDENILLRSLPDIEVIEKIKNDPVYKDDYTSELKTQYIISRLVNLSDEIKREMDKDITKEDVLDLYEKNKNNLTNIDVSFIIVALRLPNELSLSEEKEISEKMQEIQDLINKNQFQKAINLTKSLERFIDKNLTRYESNPVSLRKLFEEKYPIIFINILGALDLKNQIPRPQIIQIEDKTYLVALRVISRKTYLMSLENFFEMIKGNKEYVMAIKQQKTEKSLYKWIINKTKEKNISINFFDSTYKVDIY